MSKTDSSATVVVYNFSGKARSCRFWCMTSPVVIVTTGKPGWVYWRLGLCDGVNSVTEMGGVQFVIQWQNVISSVCTLGWESCLWEIQVGDSGVHTLQYLIAMFTRLFFTKKNPPYMLLLDLDTYTFIQKLLAIFAPPKMINREEPTSSTFLNNPNSNLKITASICLKDFGQKWPK